MELNLLEIKLLVEPKVIKETLNRCGIMNKKKKILYPSCYLYTEDNRNFLCHFKQLFQISRESAYDNMSAEDYERRNAIAFNLRTWKLIDVDEEAIIPHSKFIGVLPFNEKPNWQISHKFNFKALNTNQVI